MNRPQYVLALACLLISSPVLAGEGTARKAKKLNWKLNTKHVYNFVANKTKIGSETVVIKKVKQGYEYKATLAMKVRNFNVASTTTFVVSPNGKPLSFERTYTSPKKATIKTVFKGNLATSTVTTVAAKTQTAKLPKNVMMFDNNLMASFAAICSQLELKPGATIKIEPFHPSLIRVLPLTFTVDKKMEKVKGKDCYKVTVTPIQNTFWVTKDGRFIKAVGRGVIVELQ